MAELQKLFQAGAEGVLHVPYGAQKSLVEPFLLDMSVNPGTSTPSVIDLKGPRKLSPSIQSPGTEEPGDVTGNFLRAASAAQLRCEQLKEAGEVVSGWKYVGSEARVLDKGAANRQLAKAAETAPLLPLFTLSGSAAPKATSGNFGPGAVICMAAPTGAAGKETFADGTAVYAIDSIMSDATFNGYYIGTVEGGAVDFADLAAYDAASPSFFAAVAANVNWAVVKPSVQIEWRGSVSSLAPNLQTQQDDTAFTFIPEQATETKLIVAPAQNDERYV